MPGHRRDRRRRRIGPRPESLSRGGHIAMSYGCLSGHTDGMDDAQVPIAAAHGFADPPHIDPRLHSERHPRTDGAARIELGGLGERAPRLIMKKRTTIKLTGA